MALLRDDGRVSTKHLRHLASGEDVEALDLGPLQLVRMSVYARFEGEEAREVSDFRRADLVGLFTGGETFRWKIAGRENFVATYKRPGSGRKDFVASLKKSGSERRYYVCPRWGRLTGTRKTPEHR